MSSGLIALVGADILASIEGGGDEARFSAEPAIAKLQAWSKRYDKASLYARNRCSADTSSLAKSNDRKLALYIR